MNEQLIIATVLILTIVLSIGVMQISEFSVVVAEENGNLTDKGNMTDDTVSNMTEELSMQGEILHDR